MSSDKFCRACGRTDTWDDCDERSCPVRMEPMSVKGDAMTGNGEHIGRLKVMLQRKIAAVTARREAAFAWRSGTEADHEAAAELASRMSGRKTRQIGADERRRLADRDEHIAEMDEADGNALAAAIVALSPPAEADQ